MNNYKMLVQYDGTRYNGWQKQGDTDNTIQQKLENNIQTKKNASAFLPGVAGCGAPSFLRG